MDHRGKVHVDYMEFAYLLMFGLLIVPPVGMLLGMVKFGVVPLLLLCREDPQKSVSFEEDMLKLLPPHLPQQEGRRRIRTINIFALFCEVQALSGNGSAGQPLSKGMLRRARKQTLALQYGWEASG